VKIEKLGLHLHFWEDETRVSVSVTCAGSGGGLVTVPARLRGRLAEALEAVSEQLRSTQPIGGGE
jgi:hypothetical protein